MKALSLDDRDRLVAVCNLKTPLLSLMLSLIKKIIIMGKKYKNDVSSVSQVWEGGAFIVFFISDGRGWVEYVGILWRVRPRLTSVHVSEHISQNVQKRFKN